GGNEPSGYRFRRQRYAAKLIAFALFSSVRSFAGRRRLPLLSVVPTATSSKAAHASYMHVWAIASARATIGGPLRSDLLRRTSARADVFQSLTTVAEADVAHPSTATKAVTRSARFTRNFGIAAPAMIRESIISALLRTHRRTVHEQAIRPIPRPNPSALVGARAIPGRKRFGQRKESATLPATRVHVSWTGWPP